jgi:hypothetical protein
MAAETDDTGDVGRASLEAVRRRLVGAASSVTERIISPPPCQGGMVSSSSMRPYSTPMPVGAHIL